MQDMICIVQALRLMLGLCKGVEWPYLAIPCMSVNSFKGS